jgi:hypothetical protein
MGFRLSPSERFVKAGRMEQCVGFTPTRCRQSGVGLAMVSVQRSGIILGIRPR